jgi:hypothetical protein
MAIQYLAMMLLGVVGGQTATKPNVAVPAVAAPVVDELPAPPSVVNLRLERAERDFSMQTFEQFHRDRAEYDRRMGMARSLRQQWVEAGENIEDQVKLTAWFERAAAGTRPDLAADLPPAPRFVLVVQKHEQDESLADDDKGETNDVKKVEKRAAAAGDAEHVQSAGSKSKAADKTTATKTATVEADSIPPKPQPPAASKSTVISSLPSKIGAGVDRAFEELSGRSPGADSN